MIFLKNFKKAIIDQLRSSKHLYHSLFSRSAMKMKVDDDFVVLWKFNELLHFLNIIFMLSWELPSSLIDFGIELSFLWWLSYNIFQWPLHNGPNFFLMQSNILYLPFKKKLKLKFMSILWTFSSFIVNPLFQVRISPLIRSAGN